MLVFIRFFLSLSVYVEYLGAKFGTNRALCNKVLPIMVKMLLKTVLSVVGSVGFVTKML
jgi:hypothetical protein